MKKMAAIAAVLLVTGSLTACGTFPVGPSPSTTTATPDADAAARETFAQESAYLAELRKQLPKTDLSSVQLWLDLGHAVCAAFDSGLTPKDVFDSMQGGALSSPEASAVVVLSGIHLCPEYAPTP
jgi:hypothetical protein